VKAGVERGLVLLEYFVDAQLLNHDHLQSASEIWAPATRSQPVGRQAG
jgi:hypothetical protein